MLISILTAKSIGDTNTDTQKVLAIVLPHYRYCDINNPGVHANSKLDQSAIDTLFCCAIVCHVNFQQLLMLMYSKRILQVTTTNKNNVYIIGSSLKSLLQIPLYKKVLRLNDVKDSAY